jgi:hypothetical protein
MNVCRKNKYDLKTARTVLNEAKRNRNKQYRKECRYYLCEKCCSYHLTSESEYNEIEEVPLKLKEEWLKLM